MYQKVINAMEKNLGWMNDKKCRKRRYSVSYKGSGKTLLRKHLGKYMKVLGGQSHGVYTSAHSDGPHL